MISRTHFLPQVVEIIRPGIKLLVCLIFSILKVISSILSFFLFSSQSYSLVFLGVCLLFCPDCFVLPISSLLMVDFVFLTDPV